MGQGNYSSYDRVNAALHHKEADRIPFDFGGTEVTGMNIRSYRRLRDYLGLPNIEPTIVDTKQQLAYIDEDVQNALKVDVCNVPTDPPLNPGLEKPVTQEGQYYSRIDEWGIEWKMPVERGHYFDMVGHPLEHVKTIEELERYPWPDPLDPGRFATVKQRNDRIILEQKKASVDYNINPRPTDTYVPADPNENINHQYFSTGPHENQLHENEIQAKSIYNNEKDGPKSNYH